MLAITQEELALMIGVSRQTTNQILGALKARGVLQMQRGSIELLDLQALRTGMRMKQRPRLRLSVAIPHQHASAAADHEPKPATNAMKRIFDLAGRPPSCCKGSLSHCFVSVIQRSIRLYRSPYAAVLGVLASPRHGPVASRRLGLVQGLRRRS